MQFGGWSGEGNDAGASVVVVTEAKQGAATVFPRIGSIPDDVLFLSQTLAKTLLGELKHFALAFHEVASTANFVQRNSSREIRR